jgi:hypothetical protein
MRFGVSIIHGGRDNGNQIVASVGRYVEVQRTSPGELVYDQILAGSGYFPLDARLVGCQEALVEADVLVGPPDNTVYAHDEMSASGTLKLTSISLVDPTLGEIDPGPVYFSSQLGSTPAPGAGAIPDIVPDSLGRSPDCGLDYSYEIKYAPLPRGTTVGFYWASGTTPDTIIGGPFDTEPIGTDVGSYTLHVDCSKIGTPPAGADHVIAIADPPDETHPSGQVAEQDEAYGQQSNNVASTPYENVLTLTSSASGPVTYGTLITFTSSIAGPAGSPLPTGPVAFYLDYVPGANNLLLGKPGLVKGIAKLVNTKLPAGNHTVTAVYEGAASLVGVVSTPVAETINPAGVSIDLSDSASGPVPYGTPITLTATLANTSGTPPIPTGAVKFYDGATLIGQVGLVKGVAAFTTSRLAGNTVHSLTAVYNNNPNFTAGASAAVSQQVDAAADTINLTGSASGPVPYGTPISLTATVTNTSGTSLVPTGALKFYDGATLVGQAGLVNGVAAFTTSRLAGNTFHSLTAVYNSNPNFGSVASAAVLQQVNPAGVSIDLSDSASGPVPYGTPITLTATVTNTSGTSLVPTGTLKFYDGATLIGQAGLVNGVAAFTTSRLAGNTFHSLTAVYNSNPNFTPATSAEVSQEVDVATTSIVLAGGADAPVPYGTRVSFRANVINASTTTPIPTGVVTFYLDDAPITGGAAGPWTVLGRAALIGGSAQLNNVVVPGGNHTVTAVYAGTANFVASASVPLGQEIEPAATAVALTGTAAGPVPYRTPVVFTVTVTNTETALSPAGYVEFLDGSTILATLRLDATGKAALTRTLARGIHVITAIFLVGPNFRAGLSASVSQSVT